MWYKRVKRGWFFRFTSKFDNAHACYRSLITMVTPRDRGTTATTTVTTTATTATTTTTTTTATTTVTAITLHLFHGEFNESLNN